MATYTAEEVRENGWLIIFGKVYDARQRLGDLETSLKRAVSRRFRPISSQFSIIFLSFFNGFSIIFNSF